MDASIDDIYKLPFMKMLLHVNGEIVLLRSKDKSSMTDDERSLFELYQLVQAIMNCVDSIRMSIVFARRYNKQYLIKNQINEEQYTTYHYESIIYKIATIKDLEFKIIYKIYNLPEPSKKRKYCWTTIKENRDKINNPRLFQYYERIENKRFNDLFIDKRHKSIHDGKISMLQFEDVSGWIWLRDLGNNPQTSQIAGVDHAKSYYISRLIKKTRKVAVKDMENMYRACVDLRYMFFDTLFCDLSNLFTTEIKNNYSKVITKTFSEIELELTNSVNSPVK